MKIAYFPNQIALNGQPTLRSFLTGLKKLGHETVENSLDADAAVIWSVLWHGRLAPNKVVYDRYRAQEKPVFILEVGALRRGFTWKLSLNNINALGLYGNDTDLDVMRPSKIGINLSPEKNQRNSHILIACQHQKSLQWQGQPEVAAWIDNIIDKIKSHSDRPIQIRPHPRSKFVYTNKHATVINPIKLPNTHEEYNIDYDCHCVINYNSGPSILAPIHGTPIICDSTSLAYPVSDTIENIEKIKLPDRQDWFLKICHTEWTNKELSSGYPISRLISLCC